MEDWVYWLIAAAILGAGEIMTTGFFLGPFAVGALVATVLSAAGAGLAICFAVALVISVAVLAALRPVARAHRRLPPGLRTGAARLVGQEAIVLQTTTDQRGVVKLEGEEWSARAYEDGRVFEPGARVQVIEIKGATALVSE